MKNYIITLDTGTTNTRVILWDHDRNILARAKRDAGVRNTAIDGNNNRLKAAVKECLEKVLHAANLTFEDVRMIIASGMITSNVGLVEIPHCVAPVNVSQLAEAVKEVLIPEICPIPITFIPGIKNNVGDVNIDNFEAMDIMRGEEVESIAILEDFPPNKNYLLVLPGSHMKFVSIDKDGRILGCLTSISGELLASVTKDTIIADAVGRKFVDEKTYDREWVLLGYENAKSAGFGRACFSGRILNQFVTKDKTKIANYILGATLASDIQGIRHSTAILTDADTEVIVSGENSLTQAMIDILKHDGYFNKVEKYTPNNDVPLSALGAYKIADIKKLV